MCNLLSDSPHYRCGRSSRGEYRRSRDKALRARKRASQHAAGTPAKRAEITVTAVLGGERLTEVEAQLPTAAQPMEVLVNRDAFRKTIASGFPRLRLVEVDGPGDHSELLNRTTVVIDRRHDEDGRVIEIILDTGQHIDVEKPETVDGLVRLPFGPLTTGLFRVDPEDRPALGAADLRNVPENAVIPLHDERDRFAAVAATAFRTASDARPANLSELVPISDSVLASARDAWRRLDQRWTATLGISAEEWRAVRAERDAPTRELMIRVVERWHRLFTQVEKNLSNVQAHRPLAAHEETWLAEMGAQKRVLGAELRRLRGE